MDRYDELMARRAMCREAWMERVAEAKRGERAMFVGSGATLGANGDVEMVAFEERDGVQVAAWGVVALAGATKAEIIEIR